MPSMRGRLIGAVALALAASHPARGEPSDYAFELVSTEVKQAEGAAIVVRLVRTSTGEAVPDAVIFARRLDMEPDGMPTMTTPVEAAAGAEPGTYRFKADLPMEGHWRLSLAAKVQGEQGTIQGRLVVKAVP